LFDVREFLVVSTEPCAIAALDGVVLRRIGICVHDSIVRRKGIIIGKLGEKNFANIFRGLGVFGGGEALDS
jgi:hypothetical protein